MKIAVDGPSGSGKSTICKKVSEELGFIHIDTGSFYRAAAYFAKINNLFLDDNEVLKDEIISNIDLIEIDLNDSQKKIFLGGLDVTDEIRTEEISYYASVISKIKEIRDVMVELQRKLAHGRNVIMDGRDIATHVFPDADLKIFLTASLDERAKRRCKEYKEKGIFLDFDHVKKDIEARDCSDSTREFAPLVISKESEVIDTTNKTLDEIVRMIIKLVEAKLF